MLGRGCWRDREQDFDVGPALHVPVRRQGRLNALRRESANRLHPGPTDYVTRRLSARVSKATTLHESRLLRKPAEALGARHVQVGQRRRHRERLYRGLVDGGGQSFVQNWRRRGLLERRDRDEWSTAYEYRLSEKGFAALGDFRFTERFLQSDIALVRIKTIETAPAARFVYDLSVPGNENFIAGFGGVVCHNSRFDAIFSLIDRPESERDRNLAEHILRGHLVGEWLRRKAEGKEVYGEKPEFTEPYTPHFEPIFFRKYVAYAKRVSPVMTPDAMEAIKTKYLEIRKAGEPAGSSVPITPRQLEAIIRLSEASARARLSASVAVEDTDRAIRITEYWMRRVAGEEGRFDIDIVQTGISQSQRDQIITLRDVINQLSEQSPAGSADYEDIVRIAGERGIPQVKVDQWLKRWAQEGEVYTPGKNRYKLVERL
ncbi:MAG: hypothetical protein E6K13_08275 [Methanobacteriota archaeon]|nr:MAG: hypothetical protein E6K13_08275 [Euryarchaeota archaeon]